jgi:hypothetical protein
VTNFDLRPLSLGEILDRTFSLYRRHFVLFVGIAAVPQLAILVFNLTRLWLARTPFVLTSGGPLFRLSNGLAPLGLVGTLGIVIFNDLVYTFAHGATVLAVSEVNFGRATTIGASLRRMWGNLGRLFLITLLNLAAFFGGLILFVIPGFYVACRLITSVAAALLENLGPVESLSRSFWLTKNYAGRSFVIYLLYYFLGTTATALLAYPFYYAGGLSAKDPGMMRLIFSAGQVGSYLGAIVVGPIITISATIFYYDLRVRKEAFDLQLMMNPGPIPSATPGIPTSLT